MAGDSVLTICRVYSVNKLCGIAIASVDSGRTHAVVDGSKCPKAVAAVGVEEVAGSIRNRMSSIVKKRKRGSEGTSVVAGGQETEDAVESTRIKSFNLLDTTIKTQNKRLRAVLAANEKHLLNKKHEFIETLDSSNAALKEKCNEKKQSKSVDDYLIKLASEGSDMIRQLQKECSNYEQVAKQHVLQEEKDFVGLCLKATNY